MIKFIPVSPQNIETIRQLAAKIWNDAYADLLSRDQIDYMLNLMYSSKTIENEINDGVIWELIAENEKPVGFIGATLEESSLKLNKLYIDSSCHGKGFGQISLDHIKQLAREKGMASVYLTVNKGNKKAIKAYERAGFIKSDSKVFDIGGGFVMDDYIYTFVLI